MGRTGIAAILALLVGLAPALTAGNEPLTFRIGTLAPEGSPYYEILVAGARKVHENTSGAVRVKIFPAGAMGDEAEVLASVQSGRLDGFAGSAIAAFTQIPELAALELPYLFTDQAEAERVLGAAWPLLRKTLAARGWEGLAYMPVGFRSLGTKRPVTSLADLRKMHIRTQPFATCERFWKLAGVPAVGLGAAQVQPQLEQGTLDGFESAMTFMFASGWHTYIKHLTLTQHAFQPGLTLLGPAARKRIPARLLPRLTDGLDALIKQGFRRVPEVEQGLLASLPGLGVGVTPPPEALATELRRHAAVLRVEWRRAATPAGRTLLDFVEKRLAAQR